MAFLPLYFDTVNKQLVKSESNPGLFTMPDISQEEVLDIELTPLRRISYTTPPFFGRHMTSGLALVISIGTAGTVNATQSTWAEINGGATFSGSLDLSTAGINALTEGAAQIFEVRITGSVGLSRGLFNVRYHKGVNTSGTVQPVVNDTALGRVEATRLYVPQVMAAGQSMQWQTESGRTFIEYMHDDGTKHIEEVI